MYTLVFAISVILDPINKSPVKHRKKFGPRIASATIISQSELFMGMLLSNLTSLKDLHSSEMAPFDHCLNDEQQHGAIVE